MSLPAEKALLGGNNSDYNMFYNGATKAAGYDSNSLVTNFNPNFSYTASDTEVTIDFSITSSITTINTPLICVSNLGLDPVSAQDFDTVNIDILNNPRPNIKPLPGPLQNLTLGINSEIIWEYKSDAPLLSNPPTPLTATAVSNAQINLAWANVSNEDGYKIYRNLTNDFNTAENIANTIADTTNFSDTGLDGETLYYYWVTAYNLLSESGTAATNVTTLEGSQIPSFIIFHYEGCEGYVTDELKGLNGGTGWSSIWLGGNPNRLRVEAASPGLKWGTLTTANGYIKGSTGVGSSVSQRFFGARPIQENFYASFLMTPSGAANCSLEIESQSGNADYRIGFDTSGHLFIDNGGGGGLVTVSSIVPVGSTNLICCEFVYDTGSPNKILNVWLNKSGSTLTGAPDLVFTSPIDFSDGVDRLFFNGVDRGINFAFDEFRMGNSWAEVLPGLAPIPSIPFVKNRDPDDGATNVLISGNIYFELADNIQVQHNSINAAISINSVTNSAIVNGISQPGYAVSILSNESNGFDVTINPDIDFPYNSIVNVKIIASDSDLCTITNRYNFTTMKEPEPALEKEFPSEYAVFPTYYNPEEDKPAKIYFAGDTPKINVTIYDINGKIVNSMGTISGQEYITWDGKNNKGEKLYPGVYIIHIKGIDKDIDEKIKMIIIK